MGSPIILGLLTVSVFPKSKKIGVRKPPWNVVIPFTASLPPANQGVGGSVEKTLATSKNSS